MVVSAFSVVSSVHTTSQESRNGDNLQPYLVNDSSTRQNSDSLAPAPKDIPDGTHMENLYFVLNGLVFMDKKLPTEYIFDRNLQYTSDYFLSLHKQVSSFQTFNFNGARVKLEHSKIRVNKIRELLPPDFDDTAVLQYLEYGFPLGLIEDFVLQPNIRNHSSSYQYFTHIDSFLSSEISKGGITGPLCASPFDDFMLSPLMTAIKKPNSRRAVFDASFGDHSLNLNTPEKLYLFDDYDFNFPKIDDFSEMLLSLGAGAYMWKRDLSRFFLQLPLDPIEYNKVCFVWRGSLFFFSSFV